MAPKQESSDADNLDSLWLIYKLNVNLSMYVWEKTACTEFSTTHAYRHPPGSWITAPVDRGPTAVTQVALGLHSVTFVASVSHLLSARPGHAAPHPCSVFDWKEQWWVGPARVFCEQ